MRAGKSNKNSLKQSENKDGGVFPSMLLVPFFVVLNTQHETLIKRHKHKEKYCNSQINGRLCVSSGRACT